MSLFRNNRILIITMIICGLISACKKHDSGPICRISEVNEGAPSGYHISYNSNGTIAAITHNIGYVNTFSYLDNKITITTRDSKDSLYAIDESVLNDRGLLDSTFRKDGKGIILLINTYQYSPDGRLKTITRKEHGLPARSVDANYKDGDLISYSETSWVNNSFEYYTDLPVQDGDPNQWEQFNTFGALSIRNKHLLKSKHSSSGSNIYYSYQFDLTGKITRVNINYDSVFRYSDTYSYTCQ